MKWVIIILIVLAALLVAALIYTAMKRKKNEVARQRAGELRSEAATSAVAKQEQEARAREAAAEAERARAQADKLDARAQAERTSYDQTRATQEDRLREADRLDPDVDHRAPDYQPGAGSVPGQHAEGQHTGGQHTGGQHDRRPADRRAVHRGPADRRRVHRGPWGARTPRPHLRRRQPGPARPGDDGAGRDAPRPDLSGSSSPGRSSRAELDYSTP